MVDVGHLLLNIWWVAVAGLILLATKGRALAALFSLGASEVANVAAGAGILGSIISTIVGSILMVLFISLLLAGITHAFIIPMIPFIMVTFFITAQLVMVVESLVGAPLWAMAHVRLDGGDEFIAQQQKAGYSIALNMLLRPVLMILGLIMSNFIFGASLWLVNNTYVSAFMQATNGHLFGPISIIVGIVIFAYINYNLCIRSYNIILQLPDTVMRYIGASGENKNELNDSNVVVGGVVGAVTRRGEGVATSAAARKPLTPTKG